MIGYLRGTLLMAEKNNLVINVNNVGYNVSCGSRDATALVVGDEIIFYIETIWRDNEMMLYGFTNLPEREWFRLLGTVQGVGAKMALALLSAFSADELMQFISLKDSTALTQAAGVGAKLAQRIVNELADKLSNLSIGDIQMDSKNASSQSDSSQSDFSQSDFSQSDFSMTLAGLVQLGFARNLAHQTLLEINQKHGNLQANEMLPLALKALGK